MDETEKKKNTIKDSLKIIVPIILLFLAVIFVYSNGGTNNTPITIAQNGYIENCGFENMYLMIGSKYCSYCEDNKPIFLKLATELNKTFVIVDLSITQVEGIEVQYTPTYLFNCTAYVGAMNESNMREAMI